MIFGGYYHAYPVHTLHQFDRKRIKLGITSTGQRYFELEDIDGGRLFLPLSQAVFPAEIDEFMAEYQRKKRT